VNACVNKNASHSIIPSFHRSIIPSFHLTTPWRTNGRARSMSNAHDEWRVVTNNRNRQTTATHAFASENDRDTTDGSRRNSQTIDRRSSSIAPDPRELTNAFALIAPPRTPERRRTKKGRARKRQQRHQVSDGERASRAWASASGDVEESDREECQGGRDDDGRRRRTTEGMNEGEHASALETVGAIARLGSAGEMIGGTSGKRAMAPPAPRTPRTAIAGKEFGESARERRLGNASATHARRMAILEIVLVQMDIAFASVALAAYAVWDTVAKFLGIKVLRLSRCSRSVRSVEARVAQERAAVEEFEDLARRASGSTPSTSDVEKYSPRVKTTDDEATMKTHSLRQDREEGELTPSHVIRRRFNSSLGGAWGGGGVAPPSFRVARVNENATHAHNELISCVSQRGDDCITGGWDGTVRVWKWDPTIGLSGGLPMTGQHNDNVEFLSVESRLGHEHLAVSGGRDCTVRIWDVKKQSQRSRIYAFENIASGCVDWPSQTVAVGSRGGGVMLWDLEKGAKKCTLRGHEGEVTSMCTYDWSEGGATLFVSGGGDGTVRVWDARQQVAVATMHDHRRRVYAVCPGPKGVIFAGDFSSTIKAHSLANPNAMPTHLPNVPGFDGCEAPIAGLQFLKLDGMNGGGLLLSTAAYFPLNENEESDDDDAPQGCVHVRAVDSSGAGMGSMEGTSGDGYMYTLKGIEGLLTCASLSATSDGKRMRLLVGAGSGALGAYAEAGALSGHDNSREDLYRTSIEPAEDLGVEAFD